MCPSKLYSHLLHIGSYDHFLGKLITDIYNSDIKTGPGLSLSPSQQTHTKGFQSVSRKSAQSGRLSNTWLSLSYHPELVLNKNCLNEKGMKNHTLNSHQETDNLISHAF